MIYRPEPWISDFFAGSIKNCVSPWKFSAMIIEITIKFFLPPQIPANLETFRTEQARTAAFHHHASDATSRTGVFGHGIYQAAKC